MKSLEDSRAEYFHSKQELSDVVTNHLRVTFQYIGKLVRADMLVSETLVLTPEDGILRFTSVLDPRGLDLTNHLSISTVDALNDATYSLLPDAIPEHLYEEHEDEHFFSEHVTHHFNLDAVLKWATFDEGAKYD